MRNWPADSLRYLDKEIMKHIVFTSFIIFSFLFSERSYAQIDPIYSQYQFNQLMINPAYAGVYKQMSFSAITRLQWAGLDGAPITNTITANTSVGNSAGFGAVFLSDRIGINTTNEFIASGAYFINPGATTRLGFGLQAGFVNYKYDLDGLDDEVLADPELRVADQTFTKPNFGTGVFLMNSSYYIGLSIPRILEVKVDDGVEERQKYSRHYYLSAGYLWATKGPVDVKLSSLLRMAEGATSVDFAAMFILSNTIWAGASIRNLNTVSVSGQFQINQQFRVGYTFELPTNDLINASIGTHELMIAYDIAPLKGQAISGRYF